MTFVVVLTDQNGLQRAIGPYRTFKRAEADAKAWDGLYTRGRRYHSVVLPIESPDAFIKE